MSDAECPYCGRDTEICHDDGYGYDESRVYEQVCQHCNKTFAYRTRISFDYETKQAPCLNGGEHTLKRHRKYGNAGYVEIDRCESCEHEQPAIQSAASQREGGGT